MNAGDPDSLWYVEAIEAMHLLPQSFVFQATHSSSQGEPDGTAAFLLPAVVHFFRKPAAPPSAAGFFIFRCDQAWFQASKQTACATGSPDLATIVDQYGSCDEIISASFGNGRARSMASSHGRLPPAAARGRADRHGGARGKTLAPADGAMISGSRRHRPTGGK